MSYAAWIQPLQTETSPLLPWIQADCEAGKKMVESFVFVIQYLHQIFHGESQLQPVGGIKTLNFLSINIGIKRYSILSFIILSFILINLKIDVFVVRKLMKKCWEQKI